MMVPTDVDELEIGMYVEIPGSWLSHGFVRNRFLITSERQIEKIRESGFTRVLCRETGASGRTGEKAGTPEGEEAPPAPVVDPELFDLLHDRHLPLDRKTGLVRHFCEKVVSAVFERPSRETIDEARRGLHDVVGVILQEEEIMKCLFRITSHDHGTCTHSVNVGFYGIALARAVYRGSDAHDLEELGAAFFLHDLGKVRIDQAILNKPGKLTEEEMDEIRKHPGHGFRLLHDMKQLSEECRIIVLQHHERSDGSGYPRGLREGEIHGYGRICSVADVFDALTSDRPYRKALSPFDALKLMRGEMNHHFQKDIFEKFILLLA
ncbi:MAG TPA: HD-GYP domain-containing protein [Syntrophales bacterium]|nr:HD-GYP domain-containing protein [Syntrophales bacterium]HQN78352.1 HD-GYP domain-containing protein [Syntrophales bacterium]HQQ27670.1 HD-GYP domain-containing protein [Syntrophales bacterium]